MNGLKWITVLTILLILPGCVISTVTSTESDESNYCNLSMNRIPDTLLSDWKYASSVNQANFLILYFKNDLTDPDIRKKIEVYYSDKKKLGQYVSEVEIRMAVREADFKQNYWHYQIKPLLFSKLQKKGYRPVLPLKDVLVDENILSPPLCSQSNVDDILKIYVHASGLKGILILRPSIATHSQYENRYNIEQFSLSGCLIDLASRQCIGGKRYHEGWSESVNVGRKTENLSQTTISSDPLIIRHEYKYSESETEFLNRITDNIFLDIPNLYFSDNRFIAYANGTVLDTKTNLLWAAKDNGTDINWQNAKNYCENYRLGGYTDWRMPKLNELKGLYDTSTTYRATKWDDIVHLTELIQLSGCSPWASESHRSGAPYFNFCTGDWRWDHQSVINNYRALPVRFSK